MTGFYYYFIKQYYKNKCCLVEACQRLSYMGGGSDMSKVFQ